MEPKAKKVNKVELKQYPHNMTELSHSPEEDATPVSEILKSLQRVDQVIFVRYWYRRCGLL